MSKIIVSVCGWCEADPEKVRFMYVGPEQYGLLSTGGSITGAEWLKLPVDEDGTLSEAGVRCRDDYILECAGTAFATAIDGEYDQVDVEVENEQVR